MWVVAHFGLGSPGLRLCFANWLVLRSTESKHEHKESRSHSVKPCFLKEMVVWFR